MLKEAETIQLRCEECGGTMTIDKSRSILSCPYCGSTKIVADSDEVKMERIRNERIKDVEIHKQDQEMKKWAQEKNENNRNIKYCVLFMIVCFFILIVFMILEQLGLV